MKIIIMRHAKVDIKKRKIYANELKSVVEEYDQAPIEEHIENYSELIELTDEVDFFVSSGLRRSIDSLALLGREADEIDELFVELESPYPKQKIIKLPLYTWGFGLKLVWRLGYTGGSRSYIESKEDALKGAIKLEAFAKQHGTVLLLGHGLKNMMIVKALKRRGWGEKKRMSLKNWGFGVYEKS